MKEDTPYYEERVVREGTRRRGKGLIGVSRNSQVQSIVKGVFRLD